MGSSYDQWSMMMIKLLCTCLTLAGYCLHKNAVCTNLPGYVCKREPKNINNGKYSYISITVNSWYIFLSYLSSHHIILEIRYHLKLMQRQHLASLANRYERYRMKIYKTFFFSGLRSPLLYHLVASNGNVYKQFVASCLGEEVVNAASVINVYKGPNVHSIKTRSFAQINTPNLPPNGVACPGEC